MLVWRSSAWKCSMAVPDDDNAISFYFRNSSTVSSLIELLILRTSLSKNQTSWEMKISTPLQILHAVRHSEGMHKNALFEDRSTLVAMVTTACFMQKRRKKRVKCLFLYLKRVVEVGWSTQKYPHTGHSVINMYVVTMAWRCISPWSFHRSPQRRREMDIFRYISRFPRILSKKKTLKKEENPNWTLVNTENLRAEIATCQRQYHM